MLTLKRTIFILPVLLLFAFAGPKATIEWDVTEHDFGEIKKGQPVTVKFNFKNPGMIPLIITDVKSSCGCTVPDYPKAPIPSGGTGTIEVTYDAKNSGYFSKTVTVITNTTDGLTKLYIKGEVNE